ncbi:MAG TPA: response regulator transcription factor [Candidatus Dormibacteraeota bacterium]|nr:response regulator transcription factor [Candidatus Dormibacteraeota bacterium]
MEAESESKEGKSPRVLIIDGDQSFRRELRANCEQFGYQVIEADTAAAGLLAFEGQPPSLVLLEATLPDGSGLDVCRSLRRADAKVPILMVSARGEEIDVVVGLEIGADDYIVKPARMRELLARITAHLRKARLETTETTAGRLEFKDLVIDINERRIFRDGVEVDLTHTEFDLLAYLAGHAGKVMSREKILNHVWGYEYPIETRLIDVHIRNLRRKIEANSSRPYYILAVPGIGYRFTSART